MVTVQQLRDSDFKVRVRQYRRVVASPNSNKVSYMTRHEYENGYQKYQWGDVVLHTGGQTVVEVTDKNNVTYTGVADCSTRDTYNKRIGLAAALGRAVKTMNQPVETDEKIPF